MRDHLLGFPPVLLALDARPSCDAIDVSLARDGWALGVPERIFSEGEDKWRHSQDRMRLRELLHFECVDWTLFGTCLYGVDKQPDITRRSESIEFECVDWTFAGTHLYGPDKQPDTTGPAPEVDDELSSRLSAHLATIKVGDKVRVIRSKNGAPAKFDQQSGIVEEANDSIAVRFEGEHSLWWYTKYELIKE